MFGFLKKEKVDTFDVLVLNEPVREFLKFMHFENIPEEATHLAVYKDGQMQFMSDFSIVGILLPRTEFMSIQIYEGLNTGPTT